MTYILVALYSVAAGFVLGALAARSRRPKPVAPPPDLALMDLARDLEEELSRMGQRALAIRCNDSVLLSHWCRAMHYTGFVLRHAGVPTVGELEALYGADVATARTEVGIGNV